MEVSLLEMPRLRGAFRHGEKLPTKRAFKWFADLDFFHYSVEDRQEFLERLRFE